MNNDNHLWHIKKPKKPNTITHVFTGQEMEEEKLNNGWLPEPCVKIENTGIESLFDSEGLKGIANRHDPILYLGGRVDDDNLYPPAYIKYLNQKIKELNPKKIICHSHWYAWRYYEKGILDESMKIDIIVCHYGYLKSNTFDPVNKHKYNDNHRWCIKKLVEKNTNMIFAAYNPEYDATRTTVTDQWLHQAPPSVDFYLKWFEGVDPEFNIRNLRYFVFDRRYNPLSLVNKDLGHGDRVRNSTDGFAVLTNILKIGFAKLNIVGFTAFGSDEDDSNFSNYTTSSDPRVINRNYFNIQTSEDQRAEADILKYWIETNLIDTLESREVLNKCL